MVESDGWADNSVGATDGAAQPSRPELVHYYGDWMWRVELTDWVKSLLLFFDGLALALPTETATRLIDADPVLAQPLFELDLLHNYEPALWFKLSPNQSKEVSREYSRLLRDPRALSNDNLFYLDVLSMGFDPCDPDIYMRQLERLGHELARAKEQHREVDSLVISVAVGLISRLLHQYVVDSAIQPVIDDENAASFVAGVIGPQGEDRAKIVTSDLAHIGLDLSAIPLDEVLQFRREHGSEYRDYSRGVRQFALDLSLMSETKRSAAIADRRTELNDRAADLRKLGRAAFGRELVTLAFGLAGAAWTVKGGDLWGAAFAAGAAAAGLSKPTSKPIGAAYSYILQAKTELTR